MKKNLFLLTLISLLSFSISTSVFAGIASSMQVVKPEDEIKTMFDNELYQEIVDKYATTPRTLSAEDLSYVSQAYLLVGETDNASKYAALAVQKDAGCSRAFYVKGIVDNAKGEMKPAEEALKKAITLSPNKAEYYTALGDVYFSQDIYQSAMDNYRKAVSQKESSENAYYMIGLIYANEDDTVNALDAFYTAKNKVVKNKELYTTILYNIAKLEFDNNNYQKAAESYQELTEYFPDDFYSYEKLVECFNALENYSKADKYKERLYDAYAKGLLQPTSIFDMFCIDHFSVADKNITAYERFEEPTCRPLIKNIFYVADKENGNILSTIYMEFTPSADGGGAGSYSFIELRKDNRYTFNVIYDGNVTYSTLKNGVKDIVTGKTEAVPYKE